MRGLFLIGCFIILSASAQVQSTPSMAMDYDLGSGPVYPGGAPSDMPAAPTPSPYNIPGAAPERVPEIQPEPDAFNRSNQQDLQTLARSGLGATLATMGSVLFGLLFIVVLAKLAFDRQRAIAVFVDEALVFVVAVGIHTNRKATTAIDRLKKRAQERVNRDGP